MTLPSRSHRNHDDMIPAIAEPTAQCKGFREREREREGQMNGQTDGWTVELMDGWIDEWKMDGWEVGDS